MVYFKLEFGFHLPGRKHRVENKTNSKAQPALDFISKEVESAEARKCYKTAANYRTAANSLTFSGKETTGQWQTFYRKKWNVISDGS